MPITSKDKNDLLEIYNQYKSRYEGRKEDYFAFIYLKKKFKCSFEEISDQIAFGGNDFGIDAYYIDKEARNLYLYQFKWSENHNLFKESYERLISEGLNKIFNNQYQSPEQNDVISKLKLDLLEYKNLINGVYLQFVFKGDVESAENSAGLSDRRETLENKKWILTNYFDKRNVHFIVEYISDKESRRAPQSKEIFNLDVSELIKASVNEDKTMYVGFVSLFDLYNIYRAIGDKFFSRNIRSKLSKENTPNKKIRKALAEISIKELQEPDIFAFNHNGISMAAESVEVIGPQIKVYIPRLLNGAQTISSIDTFLHENEENPNFNKSKLKEIKLLAKIIEHQPASEFVTQVTIANNQQNPVHPWNLRANDKIQCDFQDKFKEELHIYYSRQEKAFQNLSDEELEEMEIHDSKDIEIKNLAKTFLAVQGEVNKISRMPEVFDNQKIYTDTFRQSYLKSDPRKIILAYKSLYMLNSAVREMVEYSPIYMDPIIRKARNLILALLIQGLFNHDKLEFYLRSYGESLIYNTDLRTVLKKIARTKIFNILKTIINDPYYKEQIEKEKYAFLKTKEVFNKAMEIAYDKYRWNKKSI